MRDFIASAQRLLNLFVTDSIIVRESGMSVRPIAMRTLTTDLTRSFDKGQHLSV